MPTSHVHHPNPVNQFFRLDRSGPSAPWAKTTRWNHRHANANGTVINWDGYLCMAAGGAVALDAQTGGRLRVNAGAIHDRQSDKMGGIGVDDVADAFTTYGQTLWTPDNATRYDVLDWLRQRRHVEIGVDYRHLAYAEQIQKNGQFDHAISLDDLSGSQAFKFDSLDTNGRWRPVEPYLVAAEALALRERGTKGRLFVGVTKVRPALAQLYHLYCHPVPPATSRKYAVFTLNKAETAIVSGRIETTRTGWSADATDRRMVPYPGHPSQDIVRIITGKFAGWWVRSYWAREI